MCVCVCMHAKTCTFKACVSAQVLCGLGALSSYYYYKHDVCVLTSVFRESSLAEATSDVSFSSRSG